MGQPSISTPRLPAARVGSVFTWLAGIVSCVFLLSVLALIARQIIVPPPAQRIILVGAIPLPESQRSARLAYPRPVTKLGCLRLSGH